MPSLTVPAPPPLVNIPRVELIHTGSWAISTGQWDVSLDDLTGAVAAMECPAVRRPIIKIGHTDPRFDGEPAVGWIGNLGVEQDRTLVGDYMGLPGWLAATDDAGNSVLASAWPDRSVEGCYDYVCQLGHTHPFVLTAVALLGVIPPGVGTLESLQDVGALYGVAAAAEDPSGTPVRATIRARFDSGGCLPPGLTAAYNGTGKCVRIRAATGDATSEHTGAMIALIPTDADAQRLTVDGGEPVDQLHTTLAYLGEGADFSPEQRQQLADMVSTQCDGMPPVEGDGFAISLFNPDGDEPAIVLGLGGSALADAHTRIIAAMDNCDLAQHPEQHDPWIPHLTLVYTDDPTMVGDLVDRVGPVMFDRVRLAFAGEHIDIPLTAVQAAAVAGGSPMPKPTPTVAAAVSTEDVRREYYDSAPWSQWITEIQLEPLQLIVCDDEDGEHYRVPVTITGDTFAFADPIKVAVTYVDVPDPEAAPVAASRVVYASRGESRPDPKTVAATTATIEHPAAEPANTTMEDDMPLSEFRSRLGLPDDADETAVLAAIDALTTRTPEPIAAAATVEAAEWRAEAQRLSGELADVRARQAEDDTRRIGAEKTNFFDSVVASGRLKPSERESWEGRYDRSADVTREILSARAAGSEVPVIPAGHSGNTETATDVDADFDRLFSSNGVRA